MKLFVIVLCLLSERYLSHSYAAKREELFARYVQKGRDFMMRIPSVSQPWVILAALLVPVVVLLGLVFMFLGHWIFGLIALILNIIIFYMCLGPVNPFYPITAADAPDGDQGIIKHYLAIVNSQLFAVIFWYILTGPIGLVVYRLITQMQHQEPLQAVAHKLSAILEWLPARMTVILYMIVGNFQHAVSAFASRFFSSYTRRPNQ